MPSASASWGCLEILSARDSVTRKPRDPYRAGAQARSRALKHSPRPMIASRRECSANTDWDFDVDRVPGDRGPAIGVPGDKALRIGTSRQSRLV